MNLIVFNFLHNLSGNFFIVDALGIFFAEYLPYILIIGGLFYILFKEDHWQMKFFSGFFIFLSVILSRFLLVHTIRQFYPRLRPFNILNFEPLFDPMSEFAFPSGHAALLFSLAFALFLFNKKWGFWYLFFAVINGISRVFAGIHWPVDILGGIIVGGLSFLLVYLLLVKQYKMLYKKEVVFEERIE